MNPFRTLLERGIEVGAGSDAPVTPLDPLLAVDALEHHHDPAQRLTRFEAIRLHTIGSARLAHQEEKKGSLGHGMHADFVAYPHDPFEALALDGLAPDPHGLAGTRGLRGMSVDDPGEGYRGAGIGLSLFLHPRT